jgi:DMSO/TMAO reductase YedYZ molybdopterin-dependent catalytic subunit
VLDGEVPGLSSYITPNDRFYRIDTALRLPQVSPDDWRLTIGGMVDREVELTYDDVLAMELVERAITLSCVSNEIGGSLVGNAVWTGVPLLDVLELAGIDPAAEQVVGRSVDDWTAGFPVQALRDGREALLVVGMNGEPLPVRHGFPVRLVVAGLYGYVSAVKWLRSIELTTWDGFDGYWIPRGWSKEGPMKTASRIDVPERGATVDAGRVAVAGVAWAPTRGIERVEVRVDEGAWQRARLAGVANADTWVQWVFEWDATPGRHWLEVRAVDGAGEVQSPGPVPVAPDGAEGWHRRSVDVR